MALTANKVRQHKAHMEQLNVAPVNAGSKIFVGAYIVREAATGVVIPGADSAGVVPLGVVHPTRFSDDPDRDRLAACDNTDGADGTVSEDGAERAVMYDQVGEYLFAVDSGTPKVGDPAYLIDDDTVDTSENSNGIVAGDFTKPGPTGFWYVDISKRRVVDVS